jgi:Protein of unknown function (DUF3137)
MSTTVQSDDVPRPEFKELGRLYNEELAPWLESQEGRRKWARRLRWLIIGLGLGALVALFLFLVTREEEPSGFWFFLMFVAAIGVIAGGNVPIWSLQTEAKQFVMGKLAGFFGFTYEAKPDFGDFDLCKELDLVPSHNSANFEDGLTGTIKGVPFQLVEAHLTERRGSGKSRKTVTVFRGLLLAFPYPPAAEGRVTLWQREQGRWTESEDWRPVKLGDTTFDETYIVHAADAATARRLLEATVRRAFAALLKRRPEEAKAVGLGLGDGCLLLAVDARSDSFEIGKLDHPLAEAGRVQAMVDRFAILFDVVDDFGLEPAAAEAPVVKATPGS